MTLRVLGIAGSLRSGSYNRSLLRAAAALVPDGMALEIADLESIPLYNGDVEARGTPEAVVELRARVRAADALLIATPEYNYSVPGVLKNAIDWVSRPPDQPFSGKPAAILGASPGMFGTVRAQAQLRQLAGWLNMFVLNRPEVLVPKAQEKFDAEGELTDERTRESVKKLLAALLEWTLTLRRGQTGA